MRRVVSIDNLFLSLDNPRLTDSQNEEQELEKMVNEQKDKLAVLAKDIIANGLNPLDTIAVYPSETGKENYVVAEGNRRVATMKILNNPTIISSFNKSTYNKFTKLAEDYDPITKFDIHVFESANDPKLLHWMEIKHLGEQKGKGTSSWDAKQKARYEKKVNGENLLLDFWDDLVSNDILNYEEIDTISKTNWERILRDVGLNFMQIRKSGGKLILPANIDVLREKIRCIQKRLANQSVGLVYDQEKIEQFYRDVSIELYGEDITEQKQIEFDIDVLKEDIKSNGTIEKYEIDEEKKLSKEKTMVVEPLNENPKKDEPQVTSVPIVKDIFNGCKTVIPKSFVIASSNARISKIINELKSLNPEEHPNACGTLLRLLFELSAKAYLEKIRGGDETRTEFIKAISDAANDLKNKKLINDNEHSALSKEKQTLRSLFNGYMHNTESYPSAEAIRSIFKAHKKYICACLK